MDELDQQYFRKLIEKEIAKSDGGGIPAAAIDECLSIAGLSRRAGDAGALTRTRLPWPRS